MGEHAIDRIEPGFMLQQFRGLPMPFALTLPGTGGRSDDNFFDLATTWSLDTLPIVREIYMASLMRHVRKAMTMQANFLEFWGWPEIQQRDDGTRRVYSRLRFLQIRAEPPQPRPN